MDNTKIFPLLSINDIYPFINQQQNFQFLTKHYLDYKKPAFGAFVTIDRELDRLIEYPEEVHGCHGDYDYSFNTITNNNLINRVIKLGSSTAFTDSRRQYFPSLLQDYLANIKVSVMLLPVFSVNSKGYISYNNNTNNTNNKTNNKTKRNKANSNKTKKLRGNTNKTNKFTNDKYGLIVLDNKKPRATYLPKVFPSTTTWIDITSKLKKKGGIQLSTNNYISYNAYKTDEISLTLHQFFSNKLILSLRYLEIILKLKFNESGTPIYSILSSGIEEYKPDEYVRNCGICSDVIKGIYYIKKYNSQLYTKFKKKLIEILRYCEKYLISIYNIYSVDNNSKLQFRQSMSFVIVGLLFLLIIKNVKDSKNDKYNKIINNYCNDVLNNINELESKFEFGECMVAIFTSVLFNKFKLSKQNMKSILSNTTKIVINLTSNKESIFTINWLIQMIVISLKIDNNMLSLFKLLGNKLIDCFDNYYNQLIIKSANKDNYRLDENILKIETNYLAVMYEAVLNIINTYNYNNSFDGYNIKNSNNIKDSIENNIDMNKLLDILVKISVSLINRKSSVNGLYMFKSGDIRYDITGHTIVV